VVTYVLHPGDVRSQSDGQTHYIGVTALRRLYRVPARARVIIAGVPGYREPEGEVIHCRPRYDGKYPAFES
jgi:hypothetical protein